MKVNDWVEELRNQLRGFDAETLDSEIKMADITLGLIDTQSLIHYHKLNTGQKVLREIQAQSNHNRVKIAVLNF